MSVEPYHPTIEEAQSVLKDYGKVLARVTPASYGLPISLLPHDKGFIKTAIQTLLWEIGDSEPQLRDALVQGYVFLAQFIADTDAEIVARGQSTLRSVDLEHTDLEEADRADLGGREGLNRVSMVEGI